jgi:hypothetical protein
VNTPSHRINILDRHLLRAREAMAVSSRDNALLAMRLARDELAALITLLEQKP